MSNTPQVPTDWEMWEGIQSSLEKKRKRRFLPVLLGLPFLLIMAGIIGYMLAPKANSGLLSAIEQRRDTVYLTETIHTVDTILKKEYITRWKYGSPNQTLALQSQIQTLASLNTSLQNSIEGLDQKLNEYRHAFSHSILKNDPKYTNLDFFNSSTPSLSTNESIIFDIDRSSIDHFAFSPLLDTNTLLWDRPKPMLTHNLIFENLVKNRKSKNLLDHLIPDYINIGASIEAPGLAFRKNLDPGLEFGVGFNTEIIFSPKFSIVTGIRSRSSKTKTTDPLISANFPQPMVGTEEIFKDLSVKSSFIDIPLTIKYDVLKLNQNKLYLTGGLLFSKLQQTEYKYEYVRNTTEIYYEEKAENTTGWNLGCSVFGIGYQLEALRDIALFAETNIRYNLKNEADDVNGVGFRFGMYYKI